MMEFTMYHSGKAGQQFNTYYKNAVVIRNAEDLRNVCRFDHVSVQFGNDFHRCNEDFQLCFAINADCDNSGTEEPAAWLTPEKVAERLPQVAFYDCASRNNNKTKHPGEPGEEGPRPRYHYYFPLSEPIADINQAKTIMAKLLALFPEFDEKGTKPAQFFYGHDNPETTWHPGTLDIAEYFDQHPEITIPTRPRAAAEPAEKPDRVQAAGDDETEYVRLNLADWLAVIPADDYGEWVTVGMAVKAAGEDVSLWDDFSKKSSKYPGYNAIVKKWNSFKTNGVGPGTLHHLAKKYGWEPDPEKYTGIHKAKYEAFKYQEEQRQKFRAEHREEHIAALAALDIDCAGDPYRYTWKRDFDGSIDEVINLETGEVVYQKSEEERAAARAAGDTLRPDPEQPVPGETVHTGPGAKDPGQDPAAPWEPVEKAAPLPTFPLEQFPGWIREHITNFAATTGVNTDYCAAAVISAVSAVIVGHCDIPFNGPHREPAQLYSAFVGGSGSMKSSVIGHFIGPVRDRLRLLNDNVKKDNFAVSKRIEELEKDISAEQKKAKQNKEKVQQLAEELEQKRQERKNSFPVPLDDVTPEALVSSMKFTRGTANIASAEGNIINVLTGHSYTQRGATPNLDAFLKGSDAEPIHGYRVTTGEIDIPRADISILLAVQPGLLERLLKSGDAVGRGLAQRFIIYAPTTAEDDIDHTIPVYMDPQHMERWTEHMDYIIARFMDPDKKAMLMPLEPDADVIIRKFWNYEKELKKERGADDEDSIVGWISKLHGKALRLAAIMALLRDREARTITAQDAQTAVDLFTEYYIPQFIAAYEKPDNLTRAQRQIINWIVRRAERTGNREQFTERELWNDIRHRTAFQEKAGPVRFRAALEDLRGKNYIRPIMAAPAPGGHKPAKAWQINPDTFTK